MTEEDREILIQRLSEDLIGPFTEDEELFSRPSDVYLSGILWPSSTRMGEEEDDRLSLSGGEGDGTTGTGEEEEVSRKNMNRPCTAGISFAVSSSNKSPLLKVKINFATYELIEEEENDDEQQPENKSKLKQNSYWKRNQICIEIPDFEIGQLTEPALNLESYGAPPHVYLYRRIASWEDNWLVTLTLVNGYPTEADRNLIEQNSLFQVRLEIFPGNGTSLIARPSRRINEEDEQNEEDSSTSLLYRNSLEYAVGHTCSAEWTADKNTKNATMVATTWIPQKLVHSTNPIGHEVFTPLRRTEGNQPLSAIWLGNATDEELQKALSELPAAYEEWLVLQDEKICQLDDKYRELANKNLSICRSVRDRMTEGANMIGQDPAIAEAFRLANKAMHLQYSWNPENQNRGPLTWRPFQLGFVLLSIASVANRNHTDRNTMDLLWFPTGGGKTEAYLTLIAFLAFYRRLSSTRSPDDGAGVAAMMRYTLRLLTTQQFSRASSMILACEAIRRGATGDNDRIADLGNIPFSIGLWVGGDATPNTFEAANKALMGGSDLPSPAQLADCPICRTQLNWYAERKTKSINVRCNNQNCILHKGGNLPVFTVDEDIYREKPTLLIGTVDKFAQIPRKSEINDLFSISCGHPPDLIVQDELHLISGPLGTLAGLYEVAIDRMFTREKVVPKIIGSTATIRRANEQVRALFNRDTCQFPSPAIDADDSGFAVLDPDSPGRIYAGITTAGRSAKFTLQGVTASLLQSAYGGLTDEGRDPYWTLVTYFNSLRELGGALVLMQDDVNDSIAIHADRRSEAQRHTEFIEELTSRRTQAEIREMLDMLTIKADEGGLDVVLATNMLSVGVDIPRLGLMVVNGQPKGTSEYIQATSRVGRGRVPGLVLSVLNNSKPRDRSHYESFVTWHSTLYRDVEPTSVTPFASRARDRALHAVLVSLIRHLVPGMLDSPSALGPRIMGEVESVIDDIITRAEIIDPEEIDVEKELRSILNEWMNRIPEYYWWSYKPDISLLQDAEMVATQRAMGKKVSSAWPTMNNLRSVEPSARFRLAEKLWDGDYHK